MRINKEITMKHMKKQENNLITENSKAVERWREYFKKILNEVADNKITGNNLRKTTKEKVNKTYIAEELEEVIKKIKIDKAVRDEITPETI